MNKILFLTYFLTSASLFGGWGTPFLVYNSFPGYQPVSGIDNTGNGVVAYCWQLFQDTGAGATQIVGGAPVNPVGYVAVEGPVFNVNLAVNNAGNATMVWTEHSGTFSSNFIRGVSLLNNVWSPANQLSDPQTESAQYNTLPGVTKDNANNSIGLWNLAVNLGSENTIGYNLFQSGAWVGENQLFTPTTDYLPISYLAGSPSGHGFALWSDSGPYILQGAYYNGSTWTTNFSISTDLLQNCMPAMDVSMNSSNQALMAWAKQSDGGVAAILFSGGSYGPVETVYIPQNNFTTEQIATAYNDMGDAAAAWIAYDSLAGQWNLYMAFRLNNSWQPPLLLDTINDAGASLFKANLALDGNGNAYVVWQRTDGSSNSAIVGVNIARGAVSAPSYILISTDNTIDATNPSLAVNNSGNTLVSWQSGPFGSSIIEAAVGFFSYAPSPPLNLTGVQVKNKFATQIDRVNVLSWSASQDPSVQKYYVFRNGVLVGIVPASLELTYFDHNQGNQSVYYQVTAVNAENVQSAPAAVTVR